MKTKNRKILQKTERELANGIVQKFLREHYYYDPVIIHNGHRGALINKETGKPVGFYGTTGRGNAQYRFLVGIDHKNIVFLVYFGFICMEQSPMDMSFIILTIMK